MSQRPFVGGYVCFLFLGLVGGAVLAGSAWAVKGAAGDRIPERFERYSLIQVTEVSGDRGKGVPAGGRLNRAVESARQRALERAERYLDRKLRDAGLDYEIRRAKPDGAVRILDRRALGTDGMLVAVDHGELLDLLPEALVDCGSFGHGAPF